MGLHFIFNTMEIFKVDDVLLYTRPLARQESYKGQKRTFICKVVDKPTKSGLVPCMIGNDKSLDKETPYLISLQNLRKL